MMRRMLASGCFLVLAACGGAGSSDALPSTNPLEESPAEQENDDPAPPADVAAPGYDCDTRKITCQTFAPVVCPDGSLPTVVNGCYGECVPKSECAIAPEEPVACAAYIEIRDGVCSRPKDDPCRAQDPDCVP